MIRQELLYARTHVLVRERPDAKAPVSFALLRGESVEIEPGVKAELEGASWVKVRNQKGRMGWCERHLLSESAPRKR